MEDVIKSELEAAHCWESVDYVAGDAATTAFKRRARQEVFAEEMKFGSCVPPKLLVRTILARNFVQGSSSSVFSSNMEDHNRAIE